MDNQKQYIDTKSRLKKFLNMHPFEWGRIIATVLSTFKYRYITPCIGKKTVVGQQTSLINFSRIRVGENCFLQDQMKPNPIFAP